MKRTVRHLASVALMSAIAFSLHGCDDGGPAASPDVATQQDTGPGIKPQPVTGDPQFIAQFAPIVEESKTLSLQAFLAKYTPSDAAKPVSPKYDVLAAKHMDLVQQKLQLTESEKTALKANGFVVAERLEHETMAAALLDVFQKDLPVLVTTDAVLQALHASYDDILKNLELYVLISTLDEALAKAHAAVPKLQPGQSAMAKAALADVDFHLAVARTLLNGAAVKSQSGPAVDAQVQKFLGYIAGEKLMDVEIFGSVRKEDYSQFKPRGHYAGVAELEKYFKAMMWLGRTDFRFAEYDAQKGEWLWRPRQVMGAMLLSEAVEKGAAAGAIQSAEDLITLMVGPIDYIDLQGLDKLVAEQGWKDAAAVEALTAEQVTALIDKMAGGAYGKQQIASHYLETDPFSKETTPLPPSFALLGQRFVIDSYVFSNVVYDRILWNGQKVQRVLPNPLDAMFVLGNNQVLPLLQKDFAQFPYWSALHNLRWLVDQHPPQFWEANLYNLWLDSLRQLNPPTTSDKFPFAMRTEAWRDKAAHTQLASWAQLRHDTLLYAKQSYTGGVACEHPSAYVEPYPAFFAKLKTMGGIAGQALTNVKTKEPWMKDSLAKFFADWQLHMGKLELAATHELSGQGTTAEDVEFLKGVIMAGNICGVTYSGWYPKLFYGPESVDKFKPTIADVHTNPNQGPLPGPDVLHVATGKVNLMVMTVDTCTGAETFVGPVFRYHEVDWKKIERLSDQDWEKQLQAGTAPPPPAWTSSFKAGK